MFSGVYSCTVEWSLDEPVERQFHVKVILPATARPVQARLEVREGQEAEVRILSIMKTIHQKLRLKVGCEVGGEPAPEVTWVTPARGEVTGNLSLLALSQVSRADAG